MVFSNPSVTSTVKNAPIVPISVASKVSNGLLNGKTIIFTGVLSDMQKTRTEAGKLVEMLGGITTDSIGDATIAIVGDKPGSKCQRAINKGIRIMLEPEFKKMCEDAQIL
jgi:NAD-dependent DNA ligase